MVPHKADLVGVGVFVDDPGVHLLDLEGEVAGDHPVVVHHLEDLLQDVEVHHLLDAEEEEDPEVLEGRLRDDPQEEVLQGGVQVPVGGLLSDLLLDGVLLEDNGEDIQAHQALLRLQVKIF